MPSTSRIHVSFRVKFHSCGAELARACTSTNQRGVSPGPNTEKAEEAKTTSLAWMFRPIESMTMSSSINRTKYEPPNIPSPTETASGIPTLTSRYSFQD